VARRIHHGADVAMRQMRFQREASIANLELVWPAGWSILVHCVPAHGIIRSAGLSLGDVLRI